MAVQRTTIAETAALPAERVGSASRILALDALRGVALAMMALDHAAFFVGVGLQAESYGGQPAQLQSAAYWLSGLLTNLATPIFWLLSGLSLALLEAKERRQGGSEWATTRYLLIRAAVVLALDLTVCNAVWLGSRPYVHVLTSMALGMVILSGLRLLPERLFLALTLAALLGYQALLLALAPQLGQPQGMAQALWLTFSYDTRPAVGFPVLGWAPLMWLGFLMGRRLRAPALRRPRTWALCGAALLGLWLALRLVGGYGDLGPYAAGSPWYHFLIMSKAPPSLTYLAFNLGLAALLLAALYARAEWLERAPLRWLAVIGQASLFFYVAHLVFYHVAARIALALPLPNLPGVVIGYGVWLTGALLLPALAAYRGLRKRYPQSVLRYL